MALENTLRIGITMRVTQANGYVEPRDALAQDWPVYLQHVFPNIPWLFIPNIGEEVIPYVTQWGLNAFIFSGGDDLGITPKRDTTETILLRYAVGNNLPVLGICRGLQLIYSWFGGSVHTPGNKFTEIHRARRHPITVNGVERQVNSYHQNSLVAETLPPGLQVLATSTSDGSIEAVQSEFLMGLMWHPEREQKAPEWNTKLIQNFFSITAKYV